jgi:GNAT superfamily N-acetyltransferase
MPKHIALALSKNPYAEPDDLSLVVATIQGRCVGFMAALPGRLRRGSEISKVLYGSSFWVDESFRGRGIGKRLVSTWLAEPVDISGCSMSAAARFVYESVGILGGVGPREDFLLNVRRLHQRVAKLVDTVSRPATTDASESTSHRWLTTLTEAWLSPTLTWMLYRGIGFAHRATPHDLSFIEGSRIPVDAFESVPDPRNTVFHQGVEWINWRLEWPWILNADETDDRYDAYYFRAVQPFFKMFVLDLRGADGGHRGFLVLSVSTDDAGTTTLKFLETRFAHDADAAVLVDVIAEYGRRYSVDRIVGSRRFLPYLRRNVFARFFLEPLVHEYVSRPAEPTSPLACALGEIELDPADGDFSFT